jgi:hypothetical protein
MWPPTPPPVQLARTASKGSRYMWLVMTGSDWKGAGDLCRLLMSTMRLDTKNTISDTLNRTVRIARSWRCTSGIRGGVISPDSVDWAAIIIDKTEPSRRYRIMPPPFVRSRRCGLSDEQCPREEDWEEEIEEEERGVESESKGSRLLLLLLPNGDLTVLFSELEARPLLRLNLRLRCSPLLGGLSAAAEIGAGGGGGSADGGGVAAVATGGAGGCSCLISWTLHPSERKLGSPAW